MRFLKHALRQIGGKLLVIWDGSPIHRAKVLKQFLKDGAAARVRLEQWAGYAPQLNPDEGIWKHLKCVELKNVCWPKPLGAEGRATQGQRALEAQKGRHLWLHQAAGFGGLESRAEISSFLPSRAVCGSATHFGPFCRPRASRHYPIVKS